MRKEIKVVCFDLGKVLIDFDWQIGLKRMAEKSPLSTEEISARMRADGTMLVYEVGNIETEPFFEHLKGVLEYGGTGAELRSCFAEIFTPITAHVEILRSVAELYPVGLISNTNEAHISYAEANYDFFPVFHARIYSHIVHTMKPKPEIYQAALQALAPKAGGGIDPETVVFIDDLEPNIEGAIQLGWQTVHLKPETRLADELKALGVRGV